MLKTQIEKRDGGYTRFKQNEQNGFAFQAWKVTRLDVRRVKQEDRDETQIEIVMEKCTRKKSLRVYSQYSSFILTPDDARALALSICPELGSRTP